MSEENLLEAAPDVTSLTVPEGIQRAAQSVVAPPPATPYVQTQISGSAPEPKPSYFEDDDSSYAGKLILPDGATFYYDALSREGVALYRGTPKRILDALGLTQEQARAEGFVMTAEQEQIQADIEKESITQIVVDCVRAWSLPRECTKQQKAKLHYAVKRQIAEAIVSFSIYGIDEARFRRGSNNVASAR